MRMNFSAVPEILAIAIASLWVNINMQSQMNGP
jgi:hypothetical protein